ncbi:NAD(+) diphosphatase [Pseudoalteromonas sp. BZB3]|uniref:NAD(+) diphosphatase n=1 Tax=Pseudoalteromonas sp. BZB3 TaxID=3136670 RepID=UPI0032C4A0D9
MLHYTQMSLDRASQQRKDSNWLNTQKTTNSRWLLIHQDKNFFSADLQKLQLLLWSSVAHLNTDDAVYIGHQDELHYFVLDVSNIDPDEVNDLSAGGTFEDMRKVGPKLNGFEASIGVLARGMCYWHKTHVFCGRCGTANKPYEGGHARRCQNSECRHITFPRTDPAVIMLVTHTFADGIERCLMGRQESWPEGVYSTLAGFVDPGESLEQAVLREVEEESGIIADDAQYIASQPWPFPSSLMLGFIAKAKTTEISVEQDELQDAKWFSRAELNTFAEWGDDTPRFKLTRRDSISRYLVEYWRALGE